MVILMKYIYDRVDKHTNGLSQTGLRQFVMILAIVNYMYLFCVVFFFFFFEAMNQFFYLYRYKISYPTKNIWFDGNRIELTILRAKKIIAVIFNFGLHCKLNINYHIRI
jgi:hypothetical protein